MVQLTSASAEDENTLTSPTHVFPVMNVIADAGTNFSLTLPANSLSILRLDVSGINTYTNLMLQCASPIYSGQSVSSTVLGQLSGDWINLTADSNHALTWSSSNTNIADYEYIDLGSGSSLDGSTNVHITAVFNTPAGQVAIYLNGILAGADNNVTENAGLASRQARRLLAGRGKPPCRSPGTCSSSV